MYPPDGLLTLEEVKHDVELNPHIIAPDPFASDDRLNVFPPVHLFLLTKTTELNKMNTSEDEPSSGLNGRLRPRKSNVPSPQTYKLTRKTEGKLQDKPKRLSTPSKTPSNKHDDLANKSDFSPTPQFLCAYCDRKFASKQTVSKHARRMHISSSKLDSLIACLFCNISEANTTQIIRHMVENHSDQYFVCLCCHTRFASTSELTEHKLNACEKQKPSYRSKLRQKRSPGMKKCKKAPDNDEKDDIPREGGAYQESLGFNGVVISCELKPSQVHDGADIEDNITTNLILPPSKSLGNNSALEKNAVIVLDDIQWNKRIPPNFSFHNSDADQILSRLGVVHRSPRTGESNRKDWLRVLDDSTQKFEKCFDTSFYSKVASNVQENLSKFLDGSFNFNPDPDNTIKTRKSKNSVVINTAEGFPILLASEQYSRNVFDGYMPRAIAPKHKWKWDNLESDKNVMNPDQLKRDSHANNCIITLVSRLDIWTQLSMRRKFEEKFSSVPIEKKTEKRNIIGKELKEILESREIPTTSSQVVKHTIKPTITSGHEFDFPSSLGLSPSVPSYDLQPAVLSGEWVRPRCYVCCACGAQTRDSRALSSHISLQHPNAQVQHYEIVGERLLNSDILKHLYVPPSQMCNRTRPLRGFRDCTKCSKSITLEDLHQHMLDCAGDTPTVRRRQCRYRPFGVRKRRPRLPDNTIRKKIRNDIRTRQKRQKSHIRPRTKIRTEVGDAETIRKMIADLPAKRHRVMVNPINQNCRPRRKLNQLRNKLIMKKRPSEDSTNRKKGVTRHASSQVSKKGELSGNIDKTNNLSCKEDDEDNKPLKPTLKRVINKRTRQKESTQRKPVLSKAKRKATPAKTKCIEHLVNAVHGASPTEVEKLSIDDSPKKIDVKGGAYNTREHASRGGSNNQDMQRPSCSRSNGNPDNGNQPTQNVPLKHSIARLTANSETHDKSVQFHHSFLVQQECNNTNQHVPSGQHTLFENEAAVTRLDKPPLNSPKGSADYYALQKCKLNKPRKGLNDCIAMLKNKLVDPVPCSASSQVSVQCGTDEPIELEPLIPLQKGTEFVDTKKRSDSVETTQNKSSKNCPAELNYEDVVPTQDPASLSQQHEPDRDTTSHIKNEIGSFDQETLLKQKRGRTKPKSSRVSNSQSELVPQKLIETQPGIEINPDNCTVTTTTIKKSSKTDSQCDSNPLPINDTRDDVNKHRLGDVHNKSDSAKINPSVSPESIIILEKPLDSTPFTNSVSEQDSSDIFISTDTNKQKLTNKCTENNEMSQKQSEICAERPLSKKTTEDCFPDKSLCGVQSDIPPAHASTHVESIMMIPLDLSGKIQNVNKYNDASKKESPYYTDDYYETLDLSNKCLDEGTRKETADMSEGVVDLSVKPSQSECQPSTLDLCVKSKNISNVTDLSMKALEVDVPTDLSMKGKDMDTSIDSSRKKRDEINYVQDWSGLKDKFSQIECTRLSETEVCNDHPTDLSGKTMSCTPQNNEIDFKGTTNPTEDLSEKLNYVNVPKEVQMKATRQSGSYKDSQMHKKSQEKNCKTVQLRSNDKTSTQIQKPVYDPTLKIPQYKIRAAISTAASTMSGSSDTVTKFSSTLPRPMQESSTNTNSNNIPAQERIFEPGKVPFNATICTTTGPVPVYTLPSRQITSTVSKYESTTPVYTLANACISVTKIEPASSATLTNTLLSIPMTTIANTTSVYTLAGTTIGSPINYAVLPNTGPKNPLVANNCFASTSHEVPVDTVFDVENQVDKRNGQETKTFVAIDQEAETARKIAMLPKELVDILGNMPVDHRNQLLNILPQYVSTSSSTSISETETVKTITNTTALVLQRSPPQLTRNKQISVDNMVTTSEPQIECPSNVISTSPNVHQVSKACQPSVQTTGKFNSNNKHSMPLSMPPSSPSPINFQLDVEDSKTSLPRTSQSSNEESITADEAKFPKDLLASCATKKTVKKNEDRIIDLTVDENVSLNTDVIKVTDDLSRSINLPTPEITNFAAIGKNSKQKGNNDQTASLRAVRIKAPSERHKENKLLKHTSVEPVCKTKNSKPDDNEVNKLSESTKYLAIQQAEISSTQHSNKNVMIEPKCTNEMPSTAPNAEGLVHQTLSTLIDEMVIKKDNNNLTIDAPIITKTGLVTSSISANQISHKESSDKQINEKIVPDHQSNTFDSTIQAIPLRGNDLEKLPMKNNSVEKIIDSLSNVPEQNVTLKESSELDNTGPTIILTKNRKDSKIIYEEDSDDDVSLAIIVKQKQQKIVSQREQDVCDQIQQNAKISLIKKKKKVKKLKNKILKENTLPESKTLTKINSSVKKTGNSVELIEKSQIAEKIILTTDVKTDEHSKINAMKTSHIDTAENIKLLKSQKSEEYNVNQEKDKNCISLEIRSSHIKDIETDTTPEQNCVALEVSDALMCSDNIEVTRQNKKLSENIESIKDISPIVDVSDDTKNTEHLKSKVKSTKKQKREGKKPTNVVNKELKHTSQHEFLNKKSNMSEKSYIEKDFKESNITGTSEVISTRLDKTNESVQTLEEDNDSEEIIYCGSEPKKFKTCTRTMKSSETEYLNSSVISDASSLHSLENTSTPLRRSRRGKSLFVEGFSSRHENIVQSETLPDNKTPLTKKQLIFSKLLLDEENHTNPDTLDTENTALDKSLTFSNTDDSSFASTSHINDGIDSSELASEKCKPIKRKKSPQMKQKSKKKKSLDTTPFSEKAALSDNSPNDVNSVQKESSENVSFPVSDLVPPVKENIKKTGHQTGDKLIRNQDDNAIFNDLDNTISPVADVKLDETVHESVNNTKLNSTEKRKKGKNSESCSKPKKSKLITNKEISVLDKSEDIQIETDEPEIKNKKQEISAEPRTTTCYNVPAAARRTRSKSVVVKSSVVNPYDPYDIDLDDMIGNDEPLRKKGCPTKESKINYKLKASNLSKASDIDTGDNMLANESVDNETSKNVCEKSKTESTTSNHEKNELTKSNTEINIKKSVDMVDISIFDVKPIKVKLTTDCDNTSDNVLDAVMDIVDKEDVNDSDDSSKSDVPLKKYVEEKEKKIAELSKSSEKDIENDTLKLSNKNPLKSTPENTGNVDCVPDETEEQLRSEQFMESFGFFSERKPRKSNLLATKKISETFHIIANESDDIYFGFKERSTKRQNESRKSAEGEGSTQCSSKKTIKRGRKKKVCVESTQCYCSICKKEFRRPDNYLRHQMTLLHVSKLSEIEMKVKTVPVHEEPNYLIAYKQHIDRLKLLTDKLAKQKKIAKSKIVLPTMADILADVNRTVRQQQLLRRGLSRDEALFLDCCELLKESHKTEGLHVGTTALSSNVCTACPVCPARSTSSGLDLLEKLINEDKDDTKSDGDVDSITAKTILESEEVRNLENDLISGLKEAANTHNQQNNVNYQQTLSELDIGASEACTENFSSPNAAESHYDHIEEFYDPSPPNVSKTKIYPETKDMMYPDVQEIDMFEDKFDKIKRKCRSQAAAAKQNQPVVESSSSHKGRKKSDKKKGKKSSKKIYQNTVLTKGALKGFDGIKVSIPTSEINMPAIVQPLEIAQKKKKKSSSKKKREKREYNNKYETENCIKDSPQKKVDVYEFMDNEDAELFEFRPSTLMERFKSISNKEVPSTSKLDSAADDAENSSESGSDGDDFVYMSDDYVRSDDETENSLLSCELGNLKAEFKKCSSPQKRKDAVEKNAVMGKIFKNAIRTEKKSVKCKEPENPKANLDQLFDSLLEEEPSSSMLNNDSEYHAKDDFDDSCLNDVSASKKKAHSRKSNDSISPSNELSLFGSSDKLESTSSFVSPKRYKSKSPKHRVASPNKHDSPPAKKYEDAYLSDYGPSTSKKQDISLPTNYGCSTSRKYDEELTKDRKGLSSKKRDKISSKKYDNSSDYAENSPSINTDVLSDPKESSIKEMIHVNKFDQCNDDNTEIDQELLSNDAGVARQRARRKCTVGKQNVLAETWSSESEPDGALPRSNSMESIVSSVGRKKKGRKKDGQPSGGRRGRHIAFKKQEIESRVTSSNRNTSSSGGDVVGSRDVESVDKDVIDVTDVCPPPAPVAQGGQAPASVAGAPGTKGRSRPAAHYWSPEGDAEQEHLQQHGWIVGDSHKKLVTMLAHAKGRKRNNDEKRHLVE